MHWRASYTCVALNSTSSVCNRLQRFKPLTARPLAVDRYTRHTYTELSPSSWFTARFIAVKRPINCVTASLVSMATVTVIWWTSSRQSQFNRRETNETWLSRCHALSLKKKTCVQKYFLRHLTSVEMHRNAKNIHRKRLPLFIILFYAVTSSIRDSVI